MSSPKRIRAKVESPSKKHRKAATSIQSDEDSPPTTQEAQPELDLITRSQQGPTVTVTSHLNQGVIFPKTSNVTDSYNGKYTYFNSEKGTKAVVAKVTATVERADVNAQGKVVVTLAIDQKDQERVRKLLEALRLMVDTSNTEELSGEKLKVEFDPEHYEGISFEGYGFFRDDGSRLPFEEIKKIGACGSFTMEPWKARTKGDEKPTFTFRGFRVTFFETKEVIFVEKDD
jgi:hypothetical protein